MAVNKVIVDGVTEIDLTADTVTAETLGEGATAHNSKGEIITGTMTSGDDTEFISLIETGNCSSLPASLTKIGAYAFYHCSSLALTSLPSWITSIGSSAFYYCSSLALTSLPEGVTSIGSSAFYSCSSLALTSLPKGVTSIGSSAFYGCTGLTSLTFKGTPTRIMANAFYGCTNLKDIYVPWSEGAVANAPWGATNATIHYDSEV